MGTDLPGASSSLICIAAHGSIVSPESCVIPLRSSAAGADGVPLRPMNSRLAAVHVVIGSLNAVNAVYAENCGSKQL